MLEILIIFISIFYFFQIAIFTYGALRSRPKSNSVQPKISIIIAARNEENNIKPCLESLTKINYPKEKLEIIIANDHSTDKTGEIISEIMFDFPQIEMFVPEINKSKLVGKPNAISQAIDRSNGEIIFISDADCVLPPNWVKDTVKYYDDSTGLVCGFTYLEHKKIFQGIQSLDWLFLLTIAAGSFALNFPLSCVGNNMTFRRKTYEEVGGYRGLRFSVTEDSELLLAIAKRTKWKYKFPFEKNSLVYSKACSTLSELTRQKKRWGTGGKRSPLPGIILMSAGFIISGLILLLPLLNISLNYALVPILCKTIMDFLFLYIPLKKFNLLRLYKFFPIFEIYLILYVFALPFLVYINQNVNWKGRIYKQ